MPSQSDFNTFRRLAGDFNAESVPDSDITTLLNDTTLELTRDFATPVDQFDSMANEYHTELLYKAAINYWWNKLSEYAETKHSQTIGAATQNVGEKWDRIWQMIAHLEEDYQKVQSLQINIKIGNASRFSKQTLRRIGGVEEEDTYK